MKKGFFRRTLLVMLGALLVGVFLGARPLTAHAANCIQNINGLGVSAALVNPVTFSGTLNATGCDWGIFVSPGFASTITNATIFGEGFIAVVVNGTANISHSTLQSPDEAIFVGVDNIGPGHAMISDNRIIVNSGLSGGCGICEVDAGSSVTITNNVITGQSNTNTLPVAIAAEQGTATIENNTILHNSTGIGIHPNAGLGDTVTGNLLKNNEFGIQISLGTGSLIETNRVEVGLDSSAIGIQDNQGINDKSVQNFICAYATQIDTKFAINPIVGGNVIQPTCP